jgi:AcrR family transcriptional regulator
MSPRPDRRAERLPQILAAARTVFARSSFAEARMEDIAQVAGLSKAAIYLYFPSKDELISALLQQYFAAAFADLTALHTVAGPLRDRLESWTNRWIDELESDAAYLAVGHEFFAVAARRAEVRVVVRDYYRRFRAELTTLLTTAQAQGERLALPPADLATAVVALFEGLSMLWMLDPEAIDLRVVTAHALAGWLNPP